MGIYIYMCENPNEHEIIIIQLKQIYIFFSSKNLPQAFITAEQILNILFSNL